MKVKDIIKGCTSFLAPRSEEKPLISIILPTFRRNKSGLFRKSVESVLGQTYKDFELLIVDDASTDGTADTIKELMEKDDRIGCLRHKYNVGLLAISEYEAYIKSRGDYIAFIFDDNEWDKQYLEKTKDFINKYNAKACYGVVKSYYNKNDYVELGKSSNQLGLENIEFGNFIANGGVILAREVVDTIGFYDPHISMIRICDWDLWKRIIKKYEFYETGIYAGCEKGCLLDDSLGNTQHNNAWIVAERENLRNNKELKIECYQDISINLVENYNTKYFCDKIREYYKKFSHKKWYNEDTLGITDGKTLRIMVMCPLGINASHYLSWINLKQTSKQFIFRYINEYVPLNELAYADIVVVCRLINSNEIRDYCKKNNIPCYLYFDDNFIELNKEFQNDNSLQNMARITGIGELLKYEGVFVSTTGLKQYNQNLNKNINILHINPCYNFYENNIHLNNDEIITIAYMGGLFRNQTFANIISPLLIKLSSRYKIRFICPEHLIISEDLKKSVQCISIAYSNNPEIAIQRYRKYQPCILLHCGPHISNNKFKTENALMNATKLGAVLVVTNDAPYNTYGGHKKRCSCVPNDIDLWYEELTKLIENYELRCTIYKNALQYCLQYYSPVLAIDTLYKEFSKYKPLSYYQISERMRCLTTRISFGQELEFAKHSMSSDMANIYVEVPNVVLVYSGGIKKEKSYNVKCGKNADKFLGLWFGTEGKPQGLLNICIYCDSHIIGEFELNIADISLDNCTYFEIDDLSNYKDKILKIIIRCKYDSDSDLIGVFENGNKRSLLYRITNKLGFPISVLDLLYVKFK